MLYIELVLTILKLAGVLTKMSNNTKLTTAKPLSDFMNKFHQSDYKLAFERSELGRNVDEGFVKFRVRTFKYNRTAALVNGSFISTVDLGYDITMVAQLYKFASNEYRLFPLHCQLNFCDAVAKGTLGLEKFRTQGNVVCPLLKEITYYYYNWAPEETSFPPFIPTGRYMLELQFLHKSKEMFVSNNYGTVYRPIV